MGTASSRRDRPVERSLWLDQLGDTGRRPALVGTVDADVAIVGAGYSGLWTAYYLLRHSPGSRLVVLDREHVGFGASGRNGGWAVGEVARHDIPPAMTRALFDAVAEIGRVCVTEGIECGYTRGGTIRLARTAPQLKRQRAEVRHAHAQGFGEDDLRMLSADEAGELLAAPDVQGGLFFAHTAAIQPLALARGLAAAVERLGGVIYEGTEVTSVSAGRVATGGGTVRAGAVVQATEAYGPGRGHVPLYSQMIATEPLPASAWESIGLAGRPTFADDRYVVIYGQRTADDRIAFGARGNPAYLYGSRIRAEVESKAHLAIAATLRELLPQLGDVEVTHRWGGVLAVPRDWHPHVRWDAASRAGSLGGYVGDGVAASNLAGRTLADLIVGNDTERATFPWVNHRSRRWEPEPLRWLAVNAAFTALAWSDRREARTGNPSQLARQVLRLIGR
ncbi:MAG TPA: FAD-binding oxidoreductase [Ilumatobacter sp.]|nr:FAD-binding oxidoreductase [Ilumatobacter sp.]